MSSSDALAEGIPGNYYTGRADQIEKKFLPATQVSNEVVWVNPEIEIPLRLKVGEPTDLGVFLTPSPSGVNTTRLEISPIHRRSAILGRAVFKDKDGKFYRDIDLKGIGFVTEEGGVGAVGKTKVVDIDGVLGRLEIAKALQHQEISEALLKAGIRTYRDLAIIKLNQIINANGQAISIEDAIKAGILDEGSQPAIEVRGFTTKYRVADVEAFDWMFGLGGLGTRELKLSKGRIPEGLKRPKRALLRDAMAIAAQEQGVDPD